MMLFFPLHVVLFLFTSSPTSSRFFFLLLRFRFNSITMYRKLAYGLVHKRAYLEGAGGFFFVIIYYFLSFTNRTTVIGMKSRIFNRPYRHDRIALSFATIIIYFFSFLFFKIEIETVLLSLSVRIQIAKSF